MFYQPFEVDLLDTHCVTNFCSNRRGLVQRGLRGPAVLEGQVREEERPALPDGDRLLRHLPLRDPGPWLPDGDIQIF